MGKVLVIAEKPSAGKDIARVLNCIEQKEGYMEGNGYIVTWSVGHLIGLKYPEEHEARYKDWKIEDLPFSFSISDSLKVLPNTSKQFKVIKQLIQSPDVDMLINAGDAGREGYLIQTWIYRMAGNRKPIKVLWASSLTDDAIRKAMNNLKEDKEFGGLLQEAEARAEGDHKYGINYSRALTLLKAGERTSLSYGRCQTPLLNLLVIRDREIQNFKPIPYFNVATTYQKGFKGILVNEEKERTDYASAEDAKNVIEKCKGLKGIVKSCIKEESQKKAPNLFDLAALQKRMGSKYGFSMDETLEIAQSLYEKHKILSYPRTDSRYLSSDLYGEIKEHLKHLKFGIFEKLLENIDIDTTAVDKAYFNDKKVTDHHALIPTINLNMEATYAGLTRDERKVFDEVVFSLIAIFYPPYVYDTTEILVDIGGYLFFSKGNMIKKLGYKTVFRSEDEDEKEKEVLPDLEEGKELIVDSMEVLDKMTIPPKRYTVSTIVSLMEKYQIGTPATRAEIVKKLQNPKRQFVHLENGKYFSTQFGKDYIDILPEKLKNPDLTARFEEQLKRINAGEIAKEEFLEELDKEIKQTIEELKKDGQERLKAAAHGEGGQAVKCPICSKGNMVILPKVAICSEKQNGCQFVIFRNICGKELSDKQMQQLAANGKTKKIKGFISKKTGKEFEAALQIDKEGKTSFIF